MANLLQKSHFVKFTLDIEDEYIDPQYRGIEKYSLPVMFMSNESGNADHVSFSVFAEVAHILTYTKKLFNYIQIGAEAHSIVHWLHFEKEEAAKQDQQLLN